MRIPTDPIACNARWFLISGNPREKSKNAENAKPGPKERGGTEARPGSRTICATLFVAMHISFHLEL
jgi:hypothetical protein